jgi:hypothetical protein
MLTKITGKVNKLAGENAVIANKDEFNKKLSLLEPGVYEIIIRPIPLRLQAMKKYYFSMESELARYLGYRKVELHEQLKAFIGKKIGEDGQTQYESISDIENEDEMLFRILEFQKFAAEVNHYTFKPFEH